MTPRNQAEELNGIADELAGMPSERFVPVKPPGYEALLFIQDQVVNSKLATEVRRAATTLDLTPYYLTSHGWSHPQMEELDWEAYGRAIRSFPLGKRRTLHKFAHGWLPTGTVLNRHYKTSQRCSLCGADDPVDHLLVCPHTVSLCADFKKHLTTKLREWHTEPGLQRLLLDALFGSPGEEYVGTFAASSTTSQFFTNQQAIGWFPELWQGFFVRQWQELQDDYDRRFERRTASNWTSRIMTLLWTHFLSLWTYRNHHLHHTTRGRKERSRVQAIDKELTTLHGLGRDFRFTLNRQLYQIRLSDLLGRDLAYKERWKSLA